MFQALFPTLKPFLHRIHGFCDFLSEFQSGFSEKCPNRVEQFPVEKTEEPAEQADRHTADRFVPCKPAERFTGKQIKTELTVIDGEIHEEREIGRQNHINEILKKNGAPFRAEHGAPDAQNVIRRAKHDARREKGEKAERLGREGTIHAVSRSPI